MASIFNTNRSRTRRERTFVGSECAVCEEPLEHTLRGERILQFSCSHVSHEACFYEYIKEFEAQYCPTCNAPLGLDTSRGGNVLDIGKRLDEAGSSNPQRADVFLAPIVEKLSSIVRSASVSEHSRIEHSARAQQTPTPTAWERETLRERPHSRESNLRPQQQQQQLRDVGHAHHMNHGSTGGHSREGNSRDSRESRERMERYGPTRGHMRNDSEATGNGSSGGYAETSQSGPVRKHDYDLQSMEASLLSPRSTITKNPVPLPVVSVRSEFPTLTRSRQQQTLTCLVTIEVPDNDWQPDPDDLRTTPPAPAARTEDAYARPPSPAHSVPRFYPYESPEVLEEITEALRVRVENWHGLDFSRYVARLFSSGVVFTPRDY